jgi:hypothetical protein
MFSCTQTRTSWFDCNSTLVKKSPFVYNRVKLILTNIPTAETNANEKKMEALLWHGMKTKVVK